MNKETENKLLYIWVDCEQREMDKNDTMKQMSNLTCVSLGDVIRFCSNPKNQQDVRFELDLQKELDNIPCWAYLQFRPKFVK